jgi:hypothetical protein
MASEKTEISARPPVQTERTRLPNQSAPKVANSPIDCSALAKPSPTIFRSHGRSGSEVRDFSCPK